MQLNEETAAVSLDLTGVVLDLTGEEGTDWSRLFTRWEVLVSNSASESVGVMGDDMLSLTVALTGLEVAQVEGRFDTQELSTTDATAVMDLESLQGLQVGWTDLELALALENTTGLDLMGKIHSLQRIDTLAEGLEIAAVNGAGDGPRCVSVSGLGGGVWCHGQLVHSAHDSGVRRIHF